MSELAKKKKDGFVGLHLTPDLLKALDKRVKATTLNRSQVIRLAIIDYLKANSDVAR